MPSVLHIYKDYYPPVIGGIEKNINHVATGTSDEYDVRVLVANTSAKTEVREQDGIKVIKAGCLGRFASAPLCPGFPWLLRKYAADILHFHCPNPTGDLSYLMMRPPGKIVVTYHSDVVRQKWAMAFYGYFLKRFLKRASRVLPTSPNYIESSPYLSLVRSLCTVIPLGIETAQFRKTPQIIERSGEIREKSRGLPIVLFVGRLRYYKGLAFLVQALPRINAFLMIVGTGPEKENILRLSRDLKIQDRIFLAGSVSDEELAAYYHAADIFCLPSHLRSEAYGLVQLEAMACGVPVVSCEIDTGVSFVNQNGETGLVVPPASPSHLEKALNTLLSSDELRARLGRQAQKRALEKFDVSVMIKKIKQVYREILVAPPMAE